MAIKTNHIDGSRAKLDSNKAPEGAFLFVLSLCVHSVAL